MAKSKPGRASTTRGRKRPFFAVDDGSPGSPGSPPWASTFSADPTFVDFFDEDDDCADPDDEPPDDFCPAKSGFVALELDSVFLRRLFTLAPFFVPPPDDDIFKTFLFSFKNFSRTFRAYLHFSFNNDDVFYFEHFNGFS